MVNIIKEEITIEESLRKKIEFICDFTNNKPTIINGSIRKIDKTNLTYIKPMKEVCSRNGGTSMIKSKDKIKIYNIDYNEESVVFRLY